MADVKISDLIETTALADTDELLVAASGASKKVKATHVRTWQKILDISGDSYSAFTTDNGSWSSDGSTITINAGTTLSRCRVTARQPIGMGCVYEAEVKGSSLTGTSIKMGILFAWDGAGNNGLVNYLYSADTSPESGGVYQQENDAVTAGLNINQNWNANQWYRIRAVYSGYSSMGYLDGAYIGTMGRVPNTDASYVGLMCQGGVFNFRNLKLWVPTLP